MKYLKLFEEINHSFDDFKVGDYVIITDEYRSFDKHFRNGDRCKVIKLKSENYIAIQKKGGRIANYHYSRIIPEEEYYANKYNI